MIFSLPYIPQCGKSTLLCPHRGNFSIWRYFQVDYVKKLRRFAFFILKDVFFCSKNPPTPFSPSKYDFMGVYFIYLDPSSPQRSYELILVGVSLLDPKFHWLHQITITLRQFHWHLFSIGHCTFLVANWIRTKNHIFVQSVKLGIHG